MSRRRPPSFWAPYLPRLATSWDDCGGPQYLEIDGSLVFVDISGFTALSERLARRGRVGAEELTGTLSACFSSLLADAYAAGGSLLKFGGDALLLLFDGDGHPARAAGAAIAMRTTMNTIGRVETSVGTVRLRMSVGVHSGTVHVFRAGVSHRELIVTGPGATTTVAMESTADAGEIVVSAATAALLDARWIHTAKGDGFRLRNRVLGQRDSGVVAVDDRAVDLSACIPAALRDELLAGTVESEHRVASVAFVHFDGVDGLLTSDGPGRVAGALHELVVTVQSAADEHGLTFLATDVDRDGGKIILVAGAPRARAGDEDRLLYALRAVVDHPGLLPVRVGVNRGPVFVGEVGPPYRRTYTVMGDAVNLAARVMAKAEPGEVLATADVLDHVRTAFDTTALAPFAVKGKSAPVEAFRVGPLLGRQSEGADDHLPFVGRDRELAALELILEELGAGGDNVVDVVGPSGIGKTRIVDELARRNPDLAVFRTLCEPYEAKTPYFAFRFVLRGLLGVRATGAAGGEELARAVTTAAPALLPWLPLLAAVTDVDVALTEDVAALEPRFRRDRTRWAVLELFRAVVAAPTMFVIEDAHWLDELSAELVGAVAGARDSGLPLLLCVVRSEEPDGYRPADDVPLQRIAVGPLEDADARALVASATAAAPPEPHVRDALVVQAGGNPLFLRELLRAQHSFDGPELPGSLEALIAAEIDQLPPADRRLLRYTAVLGTMFEAELLAEVLGEDAANPTRIVRRLRSFLEPSSEHMLRFRNHCHRQVAYETLPFSRRRELHARAGDAIERRAGDNVVERAAVLSFHFFHAQRYDRCWHYARLAAERARAQYANVESVELFERALRASTNVAGIDGDELAATWEALGDVAIAACTYERARTAYFRAARMRAGLEDAQALIYKKQAATALWQGRPDAAVRWIRRGLRLLSGDAGGSDLSARAELRGMYAQICQRAGKHQQAVRWCEAAIEDAISSGNRRALASAYRMLDWALIDLGRSREAVHTALALGIWVELGDLNQQAQVLATLGVFAYWQGAWDEAVMFNRRARETALRAGNLNDAASVATNGAEILIAQGRHDEAEPDLREALDLFRSLRQEVFTAEAVKCLAVVALRRGHLDDAARLFSDARVLAGDAGEMVAVELDGWLAECRLRMGQPDEAITLIDTALSRRGAVGATTFAPMLHRIRGCAHLAAGRADEGWRDFEASLEIARARGASYEVALTLDVIAAIASRSGLPLDATAEEERLRLLERLGVRWTPPPPPIEPADLAGREVPLTDDVV